MTDLLQLPKDNTMGIRNSNYFIILVATLGVAAGIVVSLMFSGANAFPETSATRTVGMQAASSCSVPSGTVAGASNNAGGSVLGASVAASEEPGGRGGESGGSTTTLITKIIGGLTTTTNATISGNGAYSNNTITTVNTSTTRIHNDTDVNVTNNNPQSAESGDASVDHNTGGNNTATSGEAENESSAKFDISVSN